MNIKMKSFPKVVSYMTLVGLKHNEFSFAKGGRSKSDFIEEVVCDFYGVTMDEIRHRARFNRIVKPRQIIIFFLRRYTELSLKDIGARMGGRDHTTAIHATSKVYDLMETDENYRKEVLHLEMMIQ